MSESELLVRRINDGTVIDHIDEGKGLHVLSAMGIDGKDGLSNIGHLENYAIQSAVWTRYFASFPKK